MRQLRYSHGSKMTDFAIECFGGYPLGVSVTRAYKWRGGVSSRASRSVHRSPPIPLEPQDAHRLLVKKLRAINVSSRNIQNYRWDKQLLIVWAFSHHDARLIEDIYTKLPPTLRANTVLLAVRCNGAPWMW